MSDLLINALLAGGGIALVSGPLGCFVVWQRMAYFGDTLAHSALLGIAFGLLLDLNLTLAVVFCSVLLALLLVLFQREKSIASDTLLGILAHSSLSAGLVAISFADRIRVDMTAYLFGDILAISTSDLLWIYGGGSAVAAALFLLWRPLLAVTIHAELARVEGVAIEKVRLCFILLMALVISVAMKIVGVLLVTSLMIIPAATARGAAKTPEQMALLASMIGMLSVVGGLFLSWQLDTPTGPSVVVVSFTLFLVSLLAKWRR